MEKVICSHCRLPIGQLESRITLPGGGLVCGSCASQQSPATIGADRGTPHDDDDDGPYALAGETEASATDGYDNSARRDDFGFVDDSLEESADDEARDATDGEVYADHSADDEDDVVVFDRGMADRQTSGEAGGAVVRRSSNAWVGWAIVGALSLAMTLGTIYVLRSGQLEDSRAAVDRANHEIAEQFNGHVARSNQAAVTGQYAVAADHLRLALDLTTDHPALLKLCDLPSMKKELANLTKLAAKNKSPSAGL